MKLPQKSKMQEVGLSSGRSDSSLANDNGAERIWSLTGTQKNVLFQRGVESHQRLLFLTMNLGGRLVAWDAIAERMFGYSETEAVGQKLNFFFHPDTFPAHLTENLVEKALAEGYVTIEAQGQRKDGHLFWLEVEITVLYDDASGLLGYSVFIQDITARKARTEALQQSERHFRSLVNTAPLFIWSADPQGYVLYANDTWQNFTGTSFEGSLGLAYKQILHPDDLEPTLEQYVKAAKSRQAFELECRLRRADGKYRWIHYSAVPQFLSNGEFEGFMGVGMDVSRRKDAELALVESENRFRALTDDMPVMMWMADADTKIVHANKAACEFYGQTLEEMVGQISQMVAHPDDLQHVLHTYDQAVRQRQAYSLECRVQRRDGEYRWVLFKGIPRLLPNGELLGFIGIGIDITERKNAELAISESEVRFRNMADASPIMIWMMDDKHNMTYANKALLDFYGQPLDAVANLGWKPYIDPNEMEKIYRVLNEAIEKRSIYEIEIYKKRADGQYRWVLVRGAPRFQDDGTYLGIVGTSMDITELRQARELLEIQVRERTLQLETANKELEAFSYSVSHDLRAPLRSIDGFSRMLLNKAKDKLEPDEQRYINIICDNTQHMGELIDDMLTLSRLSRSEMVYESVDLGQMASAILAEHQRQEPERHAEFKVADGMVVQGDASLLRVVMENLLGNAWKYSGKKAETQIEVGMKSQDGKSVVYVRDNGAGFNMKYAGKLFGAFQRLHRIDEFPGTGIGLATVQRVMHRHGGRVWAESAVDQGATFYIEFPTRS